MKTGTKLYGSMVGICVLTLFYVANVTAQQTAPPQEAGYESLKIADQFILPSSDGVDPKDRDAVSAWREQQKNVSKLLRDTQTAVSDMMKGKGSRISTTEADNWFNGYVIPSMAQTDEKALSELGKNRENFFRLYISVATNTQMRDRVIGLVIPAMQQIVEGNYHPACRVNALVLLSELNTREGNRTANRLPVPNVQMLPYMRNIVKQDSFPAYLKAPALAGIERHAAVRGPQTTQAFSDQEAQELGNEMISILENADAGETDQDLIYWMKRRAIRVLGYIGRPGEEGLTAKTIRDIIFNEDLDKLMRIDAVSAYGLIDFGSQVDNEEIRNVASKIGELVAQSAQDEANYIEKKISDIKMTVQFLDGKNATSESGSKKRKKNNFGLGGDADGGGPGGNIGTANKIPEVLPEYQRELVRRRFKNYAWASRVALIGNARFGVNGLKDYVDPASEEAKLIDALVKDIDNLMKGTDVVAPEEDEEDDKKGRSRDDEDKDKDKDEEKRTQSLADELKEALANGAMAIQSTLESYKPKEAPEGKDASGSASTAGQ